MSEGYKVILARSGQTVTVEKDSSILFALLDAGVSAPYSCSSGLCGACEVEVLSGTPDHKDFVLTEEERATNRTIMICCSGVIGDEIELDL